MDIRRKLNTVRTLGAKGTAERLSRLTRDALQNFYLLLAYPYIARRFWSRRGGEKYYQSIMDDLTLRRTHLRTQSRLVELLSGIEFQSLLEVGCGFGWNLGYLKEKFPDKDLVGCDFSNPQLEKAKRLYGDGIQFEFADASSMPYGSRSFDVVMTVGCLIHVPPKRIRRVVQEIQRVAKSYIVLMEEDPKFTEPEKVKCLSAAGWLFWHDYERLFQDRCEIILCKNESPDLSVSLDTHFFGLKT